MKILSIETSCDETAAAVVEDGIKLLGSSVASSEDLHIKTGGIVPEVAAREQVRSMIPVITEALGQSFGESVDPSQQRGQIDAIAVTIGPGLLGSLLIGVETAKALAFAWNKPLIAVNHLVGHIYGNFVERQELVGADIFPAVALVVSGGHTDLVLMKGHSDLVWLGGTLDDAAGEAFDKAARILGLGYPGGPAISKAAANVPIKNDQIKLPRPVINEPNFDFSFSGLKTALYNLVKQSSTLSTNDVNTLAYEFQEAINDCLVTKTVKAAQSFGAKTILLAGGVSANKALRDKLGNSAGNIPVLAPAFKFCTDNAAMIGSAAFFNQNFVSWENLEPDSSLSLQS